MEDFRQAWKDRANNKELTSYDHFERCLLLAIRKKTNADNLKDVAYGYLKRAFSPIVNQNKLDSGCTRWDAIGHAANTFAYRKRARNHALLRNDPENAKKYVSWLGEFCTDDELTLFFDLAEQIQTDFFRHDIPEAPYAYFFVRQDISPEQQLVQTSHVALQLGWKLGRMVSPECPMTEWDDLHFVVIGVPDLETLEATKKEVYDNIDGDVVTFREPDLNDELTAFVTTPLRGGQRNYFRKYELLRFDTESVGDDPVADTGREAA